MCANTNQIYLHRLSELGQGLEPKTLRLVVQVHGRGELIVSILLTSKITFR
jgi:hypothetical protein